MTEDEKRFEEHIIEDILNLLKISKKSEHTISAYKYDIGLLRIYLDSRCKAIALNEVSPVSVNEYYGYLFKERKFHKSTIIRNLKNLRNFYRLAVGQGYFLSNPFDSIKIPDPPETIYPEEYMLSLEEISAIFNAAKKRCQRDYCIVLLLMVARMLPEDIRNLEWDFITRDNLNNLVIEMSSRSINKRFQISEELLFELDKLGRRQEKVILNRSDIPISESAIRDIIWKIGKGAGFQKRISPMLLIHNNVTLARMVGASDAEIMCQAGFKYPHTIRKYDKFQPVVGVANKIPINTILKISKDK